MRKFVPWIVAAAVIVVIGGWAIGSYNSFVDAKQGVDKAWSDVEVQYQRRSDLVPNLVATVQQGANVEREILQNVVEARSAWAQASQAGTREDQIASASSFDSAISRLLVTVEAYPQLKSIEAFAGLSAQLEGTENRIATHRRDFNDAVRVYNGRVQRIPGRLLAGLFGFQPEPFFESDEGTESAPEVNFGSSSPANAEASSDQ